MDQFLESEHIIFSYSKENDLENKLILNISLLSLHTDTKMCPIGIKIQILSYLFFRITYVFSFKNSFWRGGRFVRRTGAVAVM